MVLNRTTRVFEKDSLHNYGTSAVCSSSVQVTKCELWMNPPNYYYYRSINVRTYKKFLNDSN